MESISAIAGTVSFMGTLWHGPGSFTDFLLLGADPVLVSVLVYVLVVLVVCIVLVVPSAIGAPILDVIVVQVCSYPVFFVFFLFLVLD